MPLTIWNHLIQPLTYIAPTGAKQDFSADDISQVKQIAAASIAFGMLEAYSSSRSLRDSMITIGLTTLVIFYVATAIFKMLKGESSTPTKDPVQPDASSRNQETSDHEAQQPVQEVEDRRSPTPDSSEEVVINTNPYPSSKPEDQMPTADVISQLVDSLKEETNESPEVPPTKPESLILTKELVVEILPEPTSIQIPEIVSALTTYRLLKITDDEAKNIYQIIDTVGNASFWELTYNAFELIALGDKVKHVHPLNFLETVLNNLHLKKSMIKIEDSTAKWQGFLRGSPGSIGFSERCNREANGDNFAPYIEGFCQVVHAPFAQVQTFIKKREWDNLVRFLIKLKNV